MTSYLPVPGGFSTLANRALSPALVLPFWCTLTYEGVRTWMGVLVSVIGDLSFI